MVIIAAFPCRPAGSHALAAPDSLIDLIDRFQTARVQPCAEYARAMKR
jgi:hypothetical protein